MEDMDKRPEWLIHKAGRGWYRPNASGYTNCPASAGRYSYAEAVDLSHPNGPDGPRDGMTILHVSDLPRRAPIIPIPGQSFSCEQDWINRASRVLTCHPQYRNTEHDGPATGWRGPHFTTMCFDQKGRRCRNGGDFQRAKDDNAYPIWWIWPDQIAPLLMRGPA